MLNDDECNATFKFILISEKVSGSLGVVSHVSI